MKGRFGRLLVLKSAGLKARQVMWLCRCDCGNEIETSGAALRKGRSISCGCYKSTRLAVQSITHGESGKTAEYHAWAAMIGRCFNLNDAAYERYGGRGITVSNQWRSDYRAFLRDMGRRPSASHSLERKDNSLGYSKGNCIWATEAMQSRNRRSNVIVEYGGKSMVLKDACAAAGLPYKTVHARIKQGWDIDMALREPIANRGQAKR